MQETEAQRVKVTKSEFIKNSADKSKSKKQKHKGCLKANCASGLSFNGDELSKEGSHLKTNKQTNKHIFDK